MGGCVTGRCFRQATRLHAFSETFLHGDNELFRFLRDFFGWLRQNIRVNPVKNGGVGLHRLLGRGFRRPGTTGKPRTAFTDPIGGKHKRFDDESRTVAVVASPIADARAPSHAPAPVKRCHDPRMPPLRVAGPATQARTPLYA